MTSAAMHIARTGLDAQNERMRVISNNLAKVNTTGFKRDRAAFETLAYQTVTANGAPSTSETKYATGLNLGTGVETTIRELAELIAELSGFTGEITWDTSMPNGQPRRNLDATRAAELFGFRATTLLRVGLERTIAWYRENALTRA